MSHLNAIAPLKGCAGYQTLLKAYISEGLHRSETLYTSNAVERFASALKKRGVPGKVLETPCATRRLENRFPRVGARCCRFGATAVAGGAL